ncbi:uncharacterized protein LOC129892157 [Solanum dulcamara]|uniref:uncharacterized protein LOC129892157 n=1 Tax=Solanum dulcamara TaxID=45834 RepID=UPI0024850314|nr:uncharacterized protein LOC129892157 [Solanum dulcamara]
MHVFDEMSVPASPKNDQMEPGVLLEESWFFGNLLDRKSRMLRCYSEPCPSSKKSQDFSAVKSMEETFSSLQKLPQGKKLNLDSRRSKPRLQRASSAAAQRGNLQRAPSLPVFVDYKEEPHDEESDFSMGKLIRQASINQVKISPPQQTSHVKKVNLQRAPSLPVFQESEQIHDVVESDFSMGKLIRQASINKVKVSPQKHTSQVLLPKASQSRAPSLPVFQESEQIHDEESDFSMGKLIRQASINKVEVSPQKHTSQGNLQRAPSLPVLAKREEIHEEENEFSMGKLIRQASLNNARVLPPKHTSKGLTRSPSISSISKHHLRRKQDQQSKSTRNSSNGLEVEDLQGFKNLDLNNEKKDSISKFANTSTPDLMEENKKKQVGLSEFDEIKRPPYSPEDHMKEQIKYWARAVASNVR